jgi:hypothetical protein
MTQTYEQELEERIEALEKELYNFRKFKRFYVPHLGTRIILAEDWTFSLFPESRNHSLWEVVTDVQMYTNWRDPNPDPVMVTFPKGAEFSVDRIYIRKGAKVFDSVTFRSIKGSCGDQKKLEKKRFWAKLADVRNMIVEVVDDE